MSQTRPYSDLVELVESLAGSDDLSASELLRIKAFANRRARKAYRASDYWPRFFKVGEERTISANGLIPLTQSGLSTIDTVLRVHERQPLVDYPSGEYEFRVDSSGIQVLNYVANTATPTSAFVTYKAALSSTYGDGTGETTDVPEEWFEYMAQGAYADWLRSEGQTEKAALEEVIAADQLQDQLIKISNQGGFHLLTRRTTYNNTSIR